MSTIVLPQSTRDANSTSFRKPLLEMDVLEQFTQPQAMGLYMVLAIGYNLLSLAWKELSGKAFAPTDPVSGITIVATMYCCYLLLNAMPIVTAAIVVLAFILLIGRFGIWQHAMNFDNTTYLSKSTWGLAMAINVFGVGVLILALLQLLS